MMRSLALALDSAIHRVAGYGVLYQRTVAAAMASRLLRLGTADAAGRIATDNRLTAFGQRLFCREPAFSLGPEKAGSFLDVLPVT